MKKGLSNIFMFLLIFGAIAGVIVMINRGYLDNTFTDAFNNFNNSNSSSEIVEVVSVENTTSEDVSEGREQLLEQLKVTLQKRNKTDEHLKLIYSYQIINGTSYVLTYSVRGTINQGDISVTYQNNYDGNLITVEIVHPFTGEGIIEFATVNGAKAEVTINLSEFMIASITLEGGLTQLTF